MNAGTRKHRHKQTYVTLGACGEHTQTYSAPDEHPAMKSCTMNLYLQGQPKKEPR